MITEAVREHEPVLIAWDAPLSFHRGDFYDRPIDYAAWSWLRTQEVEGAAAAPFANLPHWAVTCHTLGLPFGRRPSKLRLAPADLRRETRSGAFVIEVHPSLTLAIWSIEAQVALEPRRGRGRNACPQIVDLLRESLANPPALDWDYDLLDAYVAWRVAELFLDGGARWIGDPTNGAYVLPAGGAADNIEVEYEEALQEWERGNVLRRRP